MCQKVKDGLALVIAFSGAVGIALMLQSAPFAYITPDKAHDPSALQQMLQFGLSPYFQGIGLVFVLAGIAYILVGGDETVATRFDESEKK